MLKDLTKIAKDTNSFLKTFIKTQKKTELIVPMSYGLFSGGKKIRSKILKDIGYIFNVDYKTLIIIGSAVECIHAYSLIHDDLPVAVIAGDREFRPDRQRQRCRQRRW